MVMALFVLIGFGLLFTFASDERFQGNEQSIASVISHQAKEIGSYQESAAKGQTTLSQVPARVATAKELARLKGENQALRENVANLKKGIEAGKAEIGRRIQASEGYKDQYRAYVRGKAKGETMATLETRSGAVYRDVSIREVTAVGIQIRHADGQKRIPFEDLPEAMKDRFQFDAKQKVKALAAETAARDEHEAAAAVADGLADQETAKQKGKDFILAQEKTRREIAMKQSQISSLQQEVGNLNREMNRAASEANAARAAGHIHLDQGGNIAGDIRSMQNRISALQAEVSRMKSNL